VDELEKQWMREAKQNEVTDAVRTKLENKFKYYQKERDDEEAFIKQ
jgi:hypothetical protein